MFLFFRLTWIGICALSMMAQTRLLAGLPLQPAWLDGFVLGSAVFAYSFTHPDQRVRITAQAAGVAGVVCFLLPWFLTGALAPWQQATLFPAILWSMYYGLQKPGNRGFRGIPAAKPLVIALVWSWVTVVLPLPSAQWATGIFIFAGRAAFIFALALAYDLADLEYDRRHKLATLVGRMGTDKAFTLIDSALFLALLSCLANYFGKVYGLEQAIPLCISVIFSIWWLRHILREGVRQEWQKVLIDGLMPLQFLFIAITQTVLYL